MTEYRISVERVQQGWVGKVTGLPVGAVMSSSSNPLAQTCDQAVDQVNEELSQVFEDGDTIKVVASGSIHNAIPPAVAELRRQCPSDTTGLDVSWYKDAKGTWHRSKDCAIASSPTRQYQATTGQPGPKDNVCQKCGNG